MFNNLYSEYPIKLEIFTHKSLNNSGIWKRFVKSLGSNDWVEFELTNQYRAVPCSEGVRFKTESDKTFFLLKFS
jgi:hypothetical protein